MNKQYDANTFIIGILLAFAIVLIAIVAFNWGEIWGIIQAEGLLN